MKVLVSDLEGAALDNAVATCLGTQYCTIERGGLYMSRNTLDYSTDQSLGGAVIDQECIATTAYGACSTAPKNPDYWEATMLLGDGYASACGPTRLIAAMRCLVSSRMGSEVEVADAY